MAHARKFRFAVQLSQATSRKDWLSKIQRAESLGYSTVFMPDHFGEQLGPVPALAVAAEASNLRIGALVWDNDYRHPVVMAKDVATLDLLSEGRLEFGIGAGWMRTDYEHSGMPYDKPAVRVDRFEEALTIFKKAFADGPFSFEGKHYKITDYDGQPKPVQKPHPPVLIGAGGKRMLGIASREADIIGINPTLRAGEVSMDAGKDATAEATDRKVAWIKEAAGARYDDIEFNALMFITIITDNRLEQAGNFAPMFGLSPEEGLEVPYAYVGTLDQICEDAQARRERWGISYITFGEASMEVMAPVVERLAGT